MPKQQSVISFDPIESNKELGFLGRLMITRWERGKKAIPMDPYGHYMFCGPQGASKTASSLWYAEKLAKKYKKRKIYWYDENEEKYKRFNTPPEVKFFSNIGLGIHIEKYDIPQTIANLDPNANEVRIVYLDEIHTYFPREGIYSKEDKKLRNDLIALFSQLRKRNTYILSTAQIYGRLDKTLREQCLYMIDCKISKVHKKLVNDFIRQENIIADDLGRWSGRPSKIYVHGLPKANYNTKKVILS